MKELCTKLFAEYPGTAATIVVLTTLILLYVWMDSRIKKNVSGNEPSFTQNSAVAIEEENEEEISEEEVKAFIFEFYEKGQLENKIEDVMNEISYCDVNISYTVYINANQQVVYSALLTIET